MFHTISAIALLALLAAYIYVFIRDYRSIDPLDKRTTKEKIIALGRGSLTKVWLRVVSIAGLLVGQLANFAYLLDLPQVKVWLESSVKPEYVALAAIGISIIGTLARDRSQTKDERTII